MPTLYLHAIGLDKYFWRENITDGDVVLDFPGHGDEPITDPLSMTSLADYVAERLDGPFDVVGLSLGGMVALHLAIRHREIVRSLVVACSSAATSREVSLGRARDSRAGGMSAVLELTLQRWFTPQALGTFGHLGVEYARSCLLKDDPNVFALYWEAMAEHNVIDQLGYIDVPTTIIAGSEDLAVPIEATQDMVGRIKGARLEIVTGPHMLPLENQSGFSQAVRSHFNGIASR